MLRKEAKWLARSEGMGIENVPLKYTFNNFTHKEGLERYLVCRKEFFVRMVET